MQVTNKRTEVMPYSLLCLRPPGSVEKEVAALQQKLYTRLGLVSGLCLPALIPLLFVPAPADLPASEALKSVLAAGLRLHTRGYGEAGNSLFWDLASPRRFAAWRRSLLDCLPFSAAAKTPSRQTLFTPRAGFFLACREEERLMGKRLIHQRASLPENPPGRDRLSGQAELPAVLGPPREISFPVASLALLEIRLLDDPRRWWQGLIWEEKILMPLKKPKPSP
jgi:hypothetical protein